MSNVALNKRGTAPVNKHDVLAPRLESGASGAVF